MMPACKFANIYVDLPDGWLDVTDDLTGDAPPTLSRGERAIGALQFSTARYIRGAKPRFDRQVLQSLLRDFEEAHGFSPVKTLSEFNDADAKNFGVYADYPELGNFTRIWYVSDGDNLVLITFVAEQSDSDELADELREAHLIAKSIVF